ncbi:hypothetical protein Tsubulata_025586 [Turnera subulata]|uniref:C2H2-type domain-containing protein n=1 Tax=Turnera subulata TaxID=218843 RepID=A0A9Q0F1R6_9ROSI|nr:hypothetical protein Tsubulata_025586 [Turnera subulata]
MSNITGDDVSFSSGNSGGGEEAHHQQQQEQAKNWKNSSKASSTTTNSNGSTTQQQHLPASLKKKRNLPGNPVHEINVHADPSAEVIALSPNSLLATNRFVCEICNKGFQRDQNLQLHRRGHNLPWKLRQRTTTEIRKRVYVCPEPSCVHHNPARALGDLTGIKKHFSRKHGEKKWKCDKCSKKYAVQSDWKAHVKTCGTKEYKCDCGTIFSRRDSFITHRAFCDALAEENNKANQGLIPSMESNLQGQVSEALLPSLPINNNQNHSGVVPDHFNKNSLPLPHELMSTMPQKPSSGSMFSSSSPSLFGSTARTMSNSSSSLQLNGNSSTPFEGNAHYLASSATMSATALLQKAAQMGATVSNSSPTPAVNSPVMQKSFLTSMAPSTFGAMQTQNDQSQLTTNDGGFVNQFFNANGGVDNSVLNNVGMFSGMLDQHTALLKNMEHAGGNNNRNNPLQVRNPSTGASGQTTGANPSGLPGFGGDVMTVDFLGVGGSRPRNLHEHQEMEFRGISHARMQGLNHFEQQAAVEKPLWDV